jgi:hypothetical protein
LGAAKQLRNTIMAGIDSRGADGHGLDDDGLDNHANPHIELTSTKAEF